jgi:hypothetical protein
MGWQLRRGLLNCHNDFQPSSPWWRALNEGLLRDTAEARALAFGYAGEPSGPGVTAHLDFINVPAARIWYRAHNVSIAAGYLANGPLAAAESRVERFMSLSCILPDRYPLGDDAESYVAVERGFGHLMDVGVIHPRGGPALRLVG